MTFSLLFSDGEGKTAAHVDLSLGSNDAAAAIAAQILRREKRFVAVSIWRGFKLIETVHRNDL
ncbi:MAG: hypothetical protein JO127_05090 [Caulobacteraceae bacterium]|nr:hypothetical protein [Caulobacteraceae bacterium]